MSEPLLTARQLGDYLTSASCPARSSTGRSLNGAGLQGRAQIEIPALGGRGLARDKRLQGPGAGGGVSAPSTANPTRGVVSVLSAPPNRGGDNAC